MSDVKRSGGRKGRYCEAVRTSMGRAKSSWQIESRKSPFVRVISGQEERFFGWTDRLRIWEGNDESVDQRVELCPRRLLERRRPAP